MELLWFISGVLFALVGLPLIETITSLIMTWLESKKIKHTEIINDGNIRMQKAANRIEEITHPIGFTLSEEEEEYTDENI